MVEINPHAARQHEPGSIIGMQALLNAHKRCGVLFRLITAARADGVNQQSIGAVTARLAEHVNGLVVVIQHNNAGEQLAVVTTTTTRNLSVTGAGDCLPGRASAAVDDFPLFSLVNAESAGPQLLILFAGNDVSGATRVALDQCVSKRDVQIAESL